MKTTPLVKEVVINAPAQKVWEAITTKEGMKMWSFDISEFRPEVGFEFRFEAKKDDMVYRHICVISEVIPNKKLSYSWRYDGYAGNTLVTFELFPEGDKTKLKLTHEGLETFPQETTDFARENFDMGWTYILGTAIKEFAEKS